MKIKAFYNELKLSLPGSNGNERKTWATFIIEEEVDIKKLLSLLSEDRKTAIRFSWLLSDIALVNPLKLYNELPYLFKHSKVVNTINFKESFATYWNLCGVPPENEAEAIDLLFIWIMSTKINVTTKSRALFALYNLIEKYPELKGELKVCLEDQLDKNTKDFKRRAEKILKTL